KRSLSNFGCCNPRHLGLTDRFRIYRETLSRFSCAASFFSRVPLLFIKTEGALVGSFSNHTNPPMLTLINTVAGLLQY
ncbi:hypothetical protein WI664_04455, partial [Vibrio cholerae]